MTVRVLACWRHQHPVHPCGCARRPRSVDTISSARAVAPDARKASSARMTVPERSLAPGGAAEPSGLRGPSDGDHWALLRVPRPSRASPCGCARRPRSVETISNARAVAPGARKASRPTRALARLRPGAQQSLVVCVDRQTATTWLCCEAHTVPRPSLSISSTRVVARDAREASSPTRALAQSAQVGALEARPLRTLVGGDMPWCFGQAFCCMGARLQADTYREKVASINHPTNLGLNNSLWFDRFWQSDRLCRCLFRDSTWARLD